MASELPFAEADAALGKLDKVLAEKPEKSGGDFSEAMQHLTAFRTGLAARMRQAGASDADRVRLRHLNGVVSAVYGGHFPLGPVPWEAVSAARDALAELLREWRAG